MLLNRLDGDGSRFAHGEEVGVAARLEVTEDDLELPGPLVAVTARLTEEGGGLGDLVRILEPLGFIGPVDEDRDKLHS